MLRRIATNAAALAIAGLVAQLVFISIEITIARRLGEEAFGIFAAVYAMVIACLLLLDGGMKGWQIEAGSQHPDQISELWGTTLVMRLIGFVILYPLMVFVLPALGYDPSTIMFFIVFFPYALAILGQDCISAVYTARQRMVTNAIFQGSAPLLIGLLVVLALAMDYELLGVGVAYVAGGLLVTALWIFLTWRTEPPRVRLSKSGEILRKSYLYSATNLLTLGFRKGDILLLSLFVSMSQVGVYAAASKLLELAIKIPMLGYYAVSPVLFQQMQADPALYRRSADFFVRASAVSGILITVACYPSAHWLIQLLFGSAFAEAGDLLKILSASFALKFLGSALQTVLTTRAQHGVRTKALVSASLVAVTGHLLLIPFLGATGAAISVVAAETLLCFLYLAGIDDILLRRQLGKRLLALLGATALVFTIITVFDLSGPTASAMALVLLTTAVLATGYISQTEVKIVWRALRSRA